MHISILIVLASAIVPMITGFIWYNPKVLGNAWMQAAEVTPEKMKGANMAVIFIMAFVFSFLLAFEMQFLVIHQYSVYSLFNHYITPSNPNYSVDVVNSVNDMMAKYGNEFRTFKHGALHGTIGGILISLPIIGTNALFERKGFKYIAINTGFWIINMALMGGIICAFP